MTFFPVTLNPVKNDWFLVSCRLASVAIDFKIMHALISNVST